jgi:hypothetical protein
VEGYEGRVLSGMSTILSLPNVALIVEISREMLVRVGDSPRAIHRLLEAAGFTCYSISYVSGRWGSTFELQTEASPLSVDQYDALFVKQGSAFERRISALITQDGRS